ncbi:MAG: hypothetical protein ACEPOW_05795 [Bacteroidales bacterium]
MKTILYVDCETVKNLELHEFFDTDFEIYLFVLVSKRKNIAFKNEIKSYPNIKLHLINGQDRLCILSHISFSIGKNIKYNSKETEFIIISRSSEYKSLIKYMKSKSRKCRRLEDLNMKSIEHSLNKTDKSPKKIRKEENFEEIAEILRHIKPLKRPKKKDSLINYISNLHKEKPHKLELANKIYDFLIQSKLITEKEEEINYLFNEPTQTPDYNKEMSLLTTE